MIFFQSCRSRFPSIAILMAMVFLLCCCQEEACAYQGFWIRKGTLSGPSKSPTIQRTKIESEKKAPAPAAPVAVEDLGAQNGGLVGGAGVPTPVSKTKTPVDSETPDGTESKVAALPEDSSAASPTDPADASATYEGVTFSNPVKQKWRVGVVLITGNNPVRDVYTYIPIPKEWPEQTVEIFDEEIPVEFAVQKIDELEGLNRLILRGREIPAKRKIVALQTFMVTTQRVNPPSDPSIFVVPDAKDKRAKKFTESGSEISFRNNALRKQVKDLVESGGTAWEQTERIYDWVRDNIEQGSQEPKGSLAAFAKKSAHPEDVVGLFVAMCRANGVPARMVFVDGSQYAEFMLADPAGELHWFPCDVVGIRAFGKIVEPKVILQKGDNIRVPGQKKRMKFVAAYGEVKSATAPKIMQFVREPLSE